MTSREQKTDRDPRSEQVAAAGRALRGRRVRASVEEDQRQSVRDFLTRRRAGRGCGPLPLRPLIQEPSHAIPIWLAALMATPCLATSKTERHDVLWNCIGGRAVYTNAGTDTELIQPLGVKLHRGDTLAVIWRPGETTYTIEIYRSNELVA
jgi:hypothetical protein